VAKKMVVTGGIPYAIERKSRPASLYDSARAARSRVCRHATSGVMRSDDMNRPRWHRLGMNVHSTWTPSLGVEALLAGKAVTVVRTTRSICLIDAPVKRRFLSMEFQVRCRFSCRRGHRGHRGGLRGYNPSLFSERSAFSAAKTYPHLELLFFADILGLIAAP